MEQPRIIQGGLETMVATWPLARAVARAGQLGVVAGALLPVIMARRLQLGDPGGHLRRAFGQFPFPAVARRVWKHWFVPGGKPEPEPFAPLRPPRLEEDPELAELAVQAGFTEVFLAREGHDGPVGMHFHPSAELPLLPTMYGALLAMTPYLLIHHRHAPTVLEQMEALLLGKITGWNLPVADADSGEAPACCFNPARLTAKPPPPLPPPHVLIVGPSARALTAARAETAGRRVAGFIWHPEPPTDFPEAEELAALRALERPFWLAGLPPTPAQLRAARRAGAAGLVVGTPFYYCAESELAPEWKRRVFARLAPLPETASPAVPARLEVEFMASPTGFSVPVVQLAGTAADPEQYAQRERICDVGFLRQLYRRRDGSVGYRCPGENLADHVAKGGDLRGSVTQHCMCNGLLAALGLAQRRPGFGGELPLLPAGEDLSVLEQFRSAADASFAAADVVARLLGKPSR
jgi:nitronate monooxygenase